MSALKKQRRYYSGKKKRHTLKSQVIVGKRTGRVIATAFCEGRTHDFTLFKRSRSAPASAVARPGDSGCQGLDKCRAKGQTPRKRSRKHPLTDGERARNRAIARERIGCEHAIGRLKVFRILSERYRNRRRRLGLRFNLIAALCNLGGDD